MINFVKKYALWALLPLLLGACSSGPKPIAYRVDECVFCKMKIMDQRFGAQIVNSKGKHYNFDDVSCLVAYQGTGFLSKDDVAAVYLPDYVGSNALTPAEGMHYVQSEALRSPMAGNVAAFVEKDSAAATAARLQGNMLNWNDVIQLLNE